MVRQLTPSSFPNHTFKLSSSSFVVTPTGTRMSTFAIAKVDIRVPAGVTTKLLEDNLNVWLGKLDGVSWRTIQRAEALFTDPTDEIVQRVVRAATEVLG